MFIFALTSFLTQVIVITYDKSSRVSDAMVFTQPFIINLFLPTLASFYVRICFNFLLDPVTSNNQCQIN